MNDVNVAELRKNLKDILERAKAGETFVIHQRATPMAMLGPITELIRPAGPIVERNPEQVRQSARDELLRRIRGR